MKLRFLPAFLAALALPLPLLLVQAPALAQDQAAPARPDPWPFAASDLPLDPAYRVGVLGNGMRYIIRPNATPPEQGMVQLWVDFGSASEEEHQQGWAHFIEHMAFNGSTNVPEGEMVKLLEREGLAFGADTNASTGFDTTIYRLDLPRNDMALLDTALMLMREAAGELTFTPEAVEREKGVVLAERRTRDGYELRNLMDGLTFLYPGSRLATRLPIGTEEAITAATPDGLRALWQLYYRPENVALVVVGDYAPEEVEDLVIANFSEWQGAPRVAPPPIGPFDFTRAGETDIHLHPALAEEVTISTTGPWLYGADDVASRRTRLLRQIGYGIINRRMQRLARAEDPPYRGAGVGTSEVFRQARTGNLVVQVATGEWRRGLAAAQAEYRRAMQYGFTAAEVAEQVANYRSAVESNAAGAATRPNSGFVTGALTLLRDGQVPTTPESALERFNAHAPLITPEAVLAALQEEFDPLDDPDIRFEGPAAPEGGAEALRAAWVEGMALPVSPPEEGTAAAFAYTDFGPAGSITSDVTEPRTGIRQLVFGNGLRLNLKPTTLRDDQVLVQLNVDGGDMLNTRADPLATAMAASLPMGGLGAHTLDELQSVLAGRQVSLNVASAEETFRLDAATTPDDLELQLQVLAAALADPAWRPNAEAQYHRNVSAFFDRRFATPGAALSTSIGEIIHDADPRETLAAEEAYLALTFAELRRDIAERWQNGALELAIVGDFEADAAIAMVAATLGALPPREVEFRPYPDNRDRAFTTDRAMRTIRHEGPGEQAMLVMAWPTRDDEDHRASQTLDLLERVMRLRLTDVLREELGQTYSPGADASQSRTFPGFGTFDISAAIKTSEVEATRAAMLASITALREDGPSEDEVQRARQPLLEAFDNALDSNTGWMNLADRAQTEPERIDRYLAGKAQLGSITPEELRAMAAQYLDPAARLEVLVLPKEG